MSIAVARFLNIFLQRIENQFKIVRGKGKRESQTDKTIERKMYSFLVIVNARGNVIFSKRWVGDR